MFTRATSFNGDLSKWDVCRGVDIIRMFHDAAAFNGDLSKWDVSGVVDMEAMFRDAVSFNQKLCGAAWVHSKGKNEMFIGSPGSISPAVCTPAPPPATTQVTRRPFIPEKMFSPVFSPHSKAELESAIFTYLNLSPQGDGCNGPHGPIAEWDVSRVRDMGGAFRGAVSFNDDISK